MRGLKNSIAKYFSDYFYGCVDEILRRLGTQPAERNFSKLRKKNQKDKLEKGKILKIVLATSNSDKVREIKDFLKDYEIYALREICEPFDIVEDGATFAANALIKARAVHAKLRELNLADEFIALSDDSGISVEALGGRPGIYSARFSDMNERGQIIGKSATDASNRAKLMAELKALNLKSSPAHYTACIAISSKFGDEERGTNGFGYDALFIPDGFTKTLGELDNETKLKISHRSKGLELANFVLKSLKKNFS